MPQQQFLTTIKQRLANYRQVPEPAYRQKPAASMERFHFGPQTEPSPYKRDHINGGEEFGWALPNAHVSTNKINISVATVIPRVSG